MWIKRLLIRITQVVLLVVAIMIIPGDPATSAEPVPNGKGWKIMDDVRSFGPEKVTITFGDSRARELLRPFLRPIAKEFSKVTGTEFRVSDSLESMDTPCPERHHVVFGVKFRPTGKAGYSWGGPCYDLSDGSHFGGKVWITPEWFIPEWRVNGDAPLRNGIAHELGHALGLAHPNDHTDPYECPLTPDKFRPLMCSPNGGYTDGRTSVLTPMDKRGLRVLVARHA